LDTVTPQFGRAVSFESGLMLEAYYNAVLQGHQHHAALISGGCFHTRQNLTLKISQMTLCLSLQKQISTQACDCSSCQAFSAHTHPDFIVLGQQAEPLKIESVRQLTTQCQTFPKLSKKRVVLIEQADLLTIQAQNALLKTLEEPSIYTNFILSCDKARQLLITIRSRCFKIRLSPVLTSNQEQDLVCILGQHFSKTQLGNLDSTPGLDFFYTHTIQSCAKSSIHQLLAWADSMAESQISTNLAVRLWAQRLHAQLLQEQDPAHRQAQYALFDKLCELAQRAEQHVNRKLLWEDFLFSFKKVFMRI